MSFYAVTLILLCALCSISCGKYKLFYGDELLRFYNITHTRPFILDFLWNNPMGNVNPTCRRDLISFRDSLNSLHPWAISLADASGGLQSGSFSGNLINLGDYDGCLAARAPNFTGLYCLAKIRLNGRVHQNMSQIPHNVPIVWAACVPSSCGPVDLENHLGPFSRSNGFSVSVTCQAKTEWEVVEVIGLCVFVYISIVILLSTLYHKYFARSGDEIWCSFSIMKNYKILTSNSKNSLSSLNGLKVLSQLCVILQHTWLLDMSNAHPVLNKFDIYDMARSLSGLTYMGFVYVVDTFSLISGALISYVFLKKRTAEVNALELYLHRYIRLTPPIAACLLLGSTLLSAICDGPLCPNVVLPEKDHCQSTWWANLLYIQNFYPGIAKSCMAQTWYLAADMQVFLVTPLILIGIQKWRKKTIICLVVAMSVAALYGTVITYTVSPLTQYIFIDDQVLLNRFYDFWYVSPLMRAQCWSVGIIFGIYLNQCDSTTLKMSKKMYLLIWTVCLAVMMSLLLFNSLFLTNEVQTSILVRIMASAYNGLSHLIWSVCICWVIFACCKGIGGPINTILSWPVFEPLSKITYCTYLVHKFVILLHFGTTRVPSHFSFSSQISLITGIIVISYTAGLLLYFSFELPFTHLDKFILKKDVPKPRIQQSELDSKINENENDLRPSQNF